MHITPFFQNTQVAMYQGHCLEVLRQLQSETINCVVTSPPYFGLRNYDTPLQVWGGSEVCPHAWKQEPYYREGGAQGTRQEAFTTGGEANAQRIKATRWREDTRCRHCGAWTGELGHESHPVDFVQHLVEIFAEIYRVLRPDGTCWVNIGDSYAGSWGNAGSREGKQRTCSAVQVARNGRGNHTARPPTSYHLDKIRRKSLCLIPQRLAIALSEWGWIVRNEVIWHKTAALPESAKDRLSRCHEQIWFLTKSERYWFDQDAIREDYADKTKTTWGCQFKGYGDTSSLVASENLASSLKFHQPHPKRASKRDVWSIGPAPSSFEHFATYPPKVVQPCILAGCPEGGVVLDPFAGTGTTLYVAQELGRRGIGIELSQKYCKLAAQRCRQLTIWGELVEGTT